MKKSNMKNKRKNFDKFSSRSVHKRRSREEHRRALVRAVESTGVGYTPAALRELERSGDYCEPRRRICRGVLSVARGGFGFVTPEEGGGRDVFIPRDGLLGAVDGDLVEVSYRVSRDRDGSEKTEGRVTKIISVGREIVIGVLARERAYSRERRRARGRTVVIPDDPSLPLTLAVDDTAGAHEGDKVAVRLIRTRGRAPDAAEIVAVLGDSESREANYEAILLECGIERGFSPEELREAELAAAREVSPEGRVDLRDELVMTIDGEGAKDLDDAVSLRRVRGGWRLSVHIADVSYYVGEKTALDRAVMRRGTSVYFTDKVVPMLPPALSNGACSLNVGEDRYALSAIIGLDESGAIRSLELVPTIIRSRVRGVYSEVNALLAGGAGAEIRKKYGSVLPMLRRMEELYGLLLAGSQRRGALEMEIPEAEILLDGDGDPVDILPRERGVAERMIEQFMLTANEAVARRLAELGVPCVYRVHEKPDPERLDEFLRYASNLGLDVGEVKSKPSAASLSRLLCEARERELLEPVSYSLLRSMAKAKYSEVRSPHFGLGLDYYCHFTSPIRRLSDLATHRIIRRVLHEGASSGRYASYACRAAAAATEGELRALAAERRITDLYRAIYMSGRVGERFSGAISSVTAFGLFVRLDNTCEGLVPMSELPGIFVFDEGNLTMRAGSLLLRVGDRVDVVLEEANISGGRLRFSLRL